MTRDPAAPAAQEHGSGPAATPAWVHELPVKAGPPWVSMGVRTLDLAQWLVFDEHSERELALKRRLAAADHDAVFLAADGTEPVGAEVLDMVTAWLARHRPASSAETSDEPFTPTDQTDQTDQADQADGTDRGTAQRLHPLEIAAHLVPEDLCVMVARDGRFELAAASVSFPSHWRIADKMGCDLATIHRPVHHYASDLATKVDTFFARLSPERPVIRRNVSVHDHDELFCPEPPEDYDRRTVTPAQLWVRSERQTLVRLPRSGAVLFTIKTQQCPLQALGDAPAVARGLAAKYRALLPELDRLGEAAPVPRWLPDALDALAQTAPL